MFMARGECYSEHNAWRQARTGNSWPFEIINNRNKKPNAMFYNLDSL
jgi:hypothetical protein